MKRIGLFCIGIFICTGAFAKTINWYIGDTVYQTTTCESGSSITPPTPPAKNGYTFVGWAEYSPIEYLESTGTQYIDTGYIAKNSNTSMTIKFSNPITWICGSVASTGYVDDFGISAGGIRFGTQYQQGLNFSNNIFIINVNKTGYTINGQKTYWTNTPNLSCAKKIFLFWANGSGATKSGKIYFAQIYDNDVLVRDFIPVLDRNGTPCMFDKVEEKFYYNAGTGQFIAGPVIGL